MADLPEIDELDIDSKDDILNDRDVFRDDLGFDDWNEPGIPPMEKHSDLLKELTDFDKFIKDTVNGWLGLTWSQEEEKYVTDENSKPIMNPFGATWCISFMKNYTRKNNIITHIDRDQYNQLIIDIIDTVWFNVGSRYEEFGIKCNGDIFRICTELEHSAELILMGAGGGKYNELLKDTTHRTDTSNFMSNPYANPYGPQPMLPQKKSGMFGKIKNLLVGDR